MRSLPPRFRPLLRPLSVAILLVATGMALQVATLQWYAEARQASTAAESRLAQLDARYQQVLKTNRMTDDALASWARYRHGELSTTPDRVGWIESIQSLAARPGLDVTDYEFSPDVARDERQRNAPPALIALTPLRIHATVDHEEKFIELLAAIRKTGKASVQQCSLASPDMGDVKPRQAQDLDVECRFMLVSLRSR